MRDGNTARFQLVAQEDQRLPDQLVERKQRVLGDARGGHGTNTGYDRRGPPRIGHHPFREIPHLSDVGRRPIQPTQACFTAGRDRGKRLIDLVGNGGGEFAQHRDARGMGEIRSQALKLFFRSDLLGHIDCADESDRQALARLWPRGKEQRIDDAPSLNVAS